MSTEISTVDDLLDEILYSALLQYPGTLEGYLRRLWRTIQESRHQTVTPALVKVILDAAATVEPAPFNNT